MNAGFEQAMQDSEWSSMCRREEVHVALMSRS